MILCRQYHICIFLVLILAFGPMGNYAFGSITSISSGDSISTYEYWFDNDYDLKTKSAVTNQSNYLFNESISSENLNKGFHVFHIRFQNNKGHWSSVFSDYIQKISSPGASGENIIQYEYWVDNEFSSRRLIDIIPGKNVLFSQDIDLDFVTSGFHQLHCRFKDEKGIWSSTFSDFIQKIPSPVNGAKNIIQFEYWVDDDFSSKKTIAVTPGEEILFIQDVNFSHVSLGFHRFHYRFKDNKEVWGSVSSNYIQKLSERSSDENLITAYRYWFNEDDSAMTTENLLPPVNPFELFKHFNICRLPEGEYSIHFQFKDSNRAWGAVLTDTITKTHCTLPADTITIQNEVYLSESDSCFGATRVIIIAGNGTTAVFKSGSIANIVAGQKIVILSGFHSESGSNLNAHIINDSTFCEGYPVSIVENPQPEKSSEIPIEQKDESTVGNEIDLIVYPNPNNGYFNIEMKEFENVTNIVVFNAIGSVVYRKTSNFSKKTRINLHPNKHGIYFVLISERDKYFIRKILVR